MQKKKKKKRNGVGASQPVHACMSHVLVLLEVLEHLHFLFLANQSYRCTRACPASSESPAESYRAESEVEGGQEMRLICCKQTARPR